MGVLLGMGALHLNGYVFLVAFSYARDFFGFILNTQALPLLYFLIFEV
jgi:hypothetical protein